MCITCIDTNLRFVSALQSFQTLYRSFAFSVHPKQLRASIQVQILNKALLCKPLVGQFALDAPKVQSSDTNLLRFVMHLHLRASRARAKSLTNQIFVQKRGKKICSYALTNRRFVSMHVMHVMHIRAKCNCFERSDVRAK